MVLQQEWDLCIYGLFPVPAGSFYFMLVFEDVESQLPALTDLPVSCCRDFLMIWLHKPQDSKTKWTLPFLSCFTHDIL